MSGAPPNQEEDKKPNDQSATQIILKVTDFQDGNELFFKISRTTPLRKLMYAYCERKSVDFKSAFMYDGCRLKGEQTVDQAKMEDGDEIIAMRPMGRPMGGNSAWKPETRSGTPESDEETCSPKPETGYARPAR